MLHINRILSRACTAALALAALTACEGGDLFKVDAPDWLSEKVNSIKDAQSQDEVVVPPGTEDVYTIGATDFSTGWWAQFSKYYVIPDGQAWNAVFNLNINPDAPNTYKNFALILCSDAARGDGDYKEYGAIRFDNQPSGNSEWGDYIDRGAVQSTLTFNTDTDEGVQRLGGRVILTIDRTDPAAFTVKMIGASVTKTYTQKSPLPNLNADASNSNIRAFLVPEGSFINFLQSDIEPIGGFTSAQDKQPTAIRLAGLPNKVLVGTTLEEATANASATIEFEQGVEQTVPATDITFSASGDFNTTGTKTIVAVYNKTYKGEGAATPVIGYAQVDVVTTLADMLGAPDNSTGWWQVFTDNKPVAAGETVTTHFTNYAGGANWNNFVVILNAQDVATEYAVVRADNYGWGSGYENNPDLVLSGGQADWATWLAAMNGAKVTVSIKNNGNGTADVDATMIGNDGNTYTQFYHGLKVDSNNLYYRLTVDNCHLEFD